MIIVIVVITFITNVNDNYDDNSIATEMYHLDFLLSAHCAVNRPEHTHSGSNVNVTNRSVFPFDRAEIIFGFFFWFVCVLN